MTAGRQGVRSIFTSLLLVVFMLFLAFPIYYMVITSLKTPGEAYRLPPTLWPEHPSIDAFPYVMAAWDYWHALLNTVLVATSAALTSTLAGGLAAYGVTRLTFAGRPLFYAFLVGSVAVPAIVTVGPIFLAYRSLDLLNSRIGLILVFAAEALPIAFLTLFSYFKVIPRELDEAASIDGAGVLGTFFRVILPLALPGFSVTFLLIFIAVWNDFVFAFTLTVSPEIRMLTVRLFEVPARNDINSISYDLIAAGGVLILLPLVPILLRVQRQLVEGILAGAVKE